ncbi:MAG: hypothetical protein MK214_14620 [Thalassotalea sp.]|nr:hypothetical protein [Thalassotalea sp.]
MNKKGALLSSFFIFDDAALIGLYFPKNIYASNESAYNSTYRSKNFSKDSLKNFLKGNEAAKLAKSHGKNYYPILLSQLCMLGIFQQKWQYKLA